VLYKDFLAFQLLAVLYLVGCCCALCLTAVCLLYPVYTMKLARRAGSSSWLHRVNGVLMMSTKT